MVGLIQIQRLCDGGLPKGHGPCGCKGWKGFKGSLRGSWLHRSNKSKVLTSFKGSRAQGLPCEVHGFKGLICQSSLKSFKGSRTSGVKG